METKWPDSLLDSFKQRGDSLADQVVEQLQQNHDLDQVNRALQHLDENDETLPSGLPPVLVDYLTETANLPDWADMHAIDTAQRFFSCRGPVFGVVLLCGSLPVLYAGGLGGAQVLAATEQFSNHYARRAGETLRFILDAMEPDGLAPNGKGVRTIQKVRLMHASIRYYVKRSPDAWPAKPEWGAPINQEELMGTLLAFSSEALLGLEKMGIDVTDEEKNAYFHTWKVIGHMLGIEPGIMPNDLDDALVLWQRIAQRNFIRTNDGLMLAKAHLNFLEELIPGELFDGIAVSLMRYLMGKEISQGLLGMPQPGWTSILINFLRGVFGLKELLIDSSRTLAEIAEKDSILFMEGLARYWMQNDRTPFRIPPSLTQR